MLALPEVWWAPTLCWTLSYALSVGLRHTSHAIIVFGPHTDPAWLAMTKTYLTYLSTIIASTAINLALVAGASMSHEAALLITATFSVGWSYFALSYTWRRTSDKSEWRSCCVVDAVHGQRWYRSVEVPDASLEEVVPCSARQAVPSAAEPTSPSTTPARLTQMGAARDEQGFTSPAGSDVTSCMSPCMEPGSCSSETSLRSTKTCSHGGRDVSPVPLQFASTVDVLPPPPHTCRVAASLARTG